MKLTRAGFFGAIGAALFGAKAAPAVSRLAVVPVPRKYTMTTMPVLSIRACDITAGAITCSSINLEELEKLTRGLRHHGITL